jgi:hypothetical protein
MHYGVELVALGGVVISGVMGSKPAEVMDF